MTKTKIFCEDCGALLGELEEGYVLTSDDPWIVGEIVCKSCAEKRDKEQEERMKKLRERWSPKIR